MQWPKLLKQYSLATYSGVSPEVLGTVDCWLPQLNLMGRSGVSGEREYNFVYTCDGTEDSTCYFRCGFGQYYSFSLPQVTAGDQIYLSAPGWRQAYVQQISFFAGILENDLLLNWNGSVTNLAFEVRNSPIGAYLAANKFAAIAEPAAATLESPVLFKPVKVKQIQVNSFSFDLAEYLDNNYLDYENNLVLRAVKLDGGEWVSDEFRAVKGELIRRVGLIANYDSEVLTTPYNCSSGELSAGAEVYYVLPQEEITWPGALPLREFAGSGAWDTVVMDEVKPWLEVQAVIRV